jgi:hypothetical protein
LTIHGLGILAEKELRGINVLEAMEPFFLDQVFEVADVFGLRNLDSKRLIRLVTENKAVGGEQLRGVGHYIDFKDESKENIMATYPRSEHEIRVDSGHTRQFSQIALCMPKKAIERTLALTNWPYSDLFQQKCMHFSISVIICRADSHI